MPNKNEIVTNNLNNNKGTLSIKISKAFAIIYCCCEISRHGCKSDTAVTF